ncbi:hypothetical protein KSP40_PGU006050 [Platanthera guangdongensis]|uniref:Uncharacterized protein n=1 Tax=Platanthera guangdongensis TaxID=2320717 RepID=A0ABR2MPJ2_9ASPA
MKKNTPEVHRGGCFLCMNVMKFKTSGGVSDVDVIAIYKFGVSSGERPFCHQNRC